MALIIISGVSYSGKTTFVKFLAEHYATSRVVTTTTRAPREGEIAGVDYHFVKRNDFAKLIASGELLEHVEFAGNFYGTTKAEVLKYTDSLNVGTLIVEPIGHMAIRHYLNSTGRITDYASIFIDCPEQVVQQRLSDRFKEQEGNERAQKQLMERYETAQPVEAKWSLEAREGAYELYVPSLIGEAAMDELAGNLSRGVVCSMLKQVKNTN